MFGAAGRAVRNVTLHGDGGRHPGQRPGSQKRQIGGALEKPVFDAPAAGIHGLAHRLFTVGVHHDRTAPLRCGPDPNGQRPGRELGRSGSAECFQAVETGMDELDVIDGIRTVSDGPGQIIPGGKGRPISFP